MAEAAEADVADLHHQDCGAETRGDRGRSATREIVEPSAKDVSRLHSWVTRNIPPAPARSGLSREKARAAVPEKPGRIGRSRLTPRRGRLQVHFPGAHRRTAFPPSSTLRNLSQTGILLHPAFLPELRRLAPRRLATRVHRPAGTRSDPGPDETQNLVLLSRILIY